MRLTIKLLLCPDTVCLLNQVFANNFEVTNISIYLNLTVFIIEIRKGFQCTKAIFCSAVLEI